MRDDRIFRQKVIVTKQINISFYCEFSRAKFTLCLNPFKKIRPKGCDINASQLKGCVTLLVKRIYQYFFYLSTSSITTRCIQNECMRIDLGFFDVYASLITYYWSLKKWGIFKNVNLIQQTPPVAFRGMRAQQLSFQKQTLILTAYTIIVMVASLEATKNFSRYEYRELVHSMSKGSKRHFSGNEIKAIGFSLSY